MSLSQLSYTIGTGEKEFAKICLDLIVPVIDNVVNAGFL